MADEKAIPTPQALPVRDAQGHLPGMTFFIVDDNGQGAYRAHIEKAMKQGLNVHDTQAVKTVPTTAPLMKTK